MFTRRSTVIAILAVCLAMFSSRGAEAWAIEPVKIKSPTNGSTIPAGQQITCGGTKDLTGAVAVVVKYTRNGLTTQQTTTTTNNMTMFMCTTPVGGYQSGDSVEFTATDTVNGGTDTVTVTIQ